MAMYGTREALNFAEVKKLVDGWCEEIGIDSLEMMSYPYRPAEQLSIRQTMWRMYQEERINSVKAMRGWFDRQVAIAR